MATQRWKPVSFYLKLSAITFFVTVLSVIFLTAAGMATAVTIPLKSSLCCKTPARFGADYEEMEFSTADGLTLSGWYVPPQNEAVIILIHSYYADRRQTLPVAEMLYKHGYGLLMYDQRASGKSDGTIRSLGTLDIPDLKAAVDWLTLRQKNVKIGAYGCSMGGAIAIAGAADVPAMRAIVVDAPSPLQWNENLPQFSLHDPLSLPITALYYQLILLRVRRLPPTGTVAAVQNYGARPILFISTGQDGEFSRVKTYFEAALGPKTHWNFPDASHCTASGAHPQEYEHQLVNFFNSFLPNE